jgi:hypothetical protein
MDQPTEPLPLFEETRIRARILPYNLNLYRQARFMVPPVSVRIDVTQALAQPRVARPWPSLASGTPTDLRVTLSPQGRLWLVATLEGLPPSTGQELLPGSFSVRSSLNRLGIDIKREAIADLAERLTPVFPDHRILFRLYPRLATGLAQFNQDHSYSRVLIAL